jgi:peptidoglycan/LPS O-acetylase OafA/YrhL
MATSTQTPSAPRAAAPIRRIPALDGLRGVAALMVLFHHTLLLLPDYANYEWFGSKAPVHGWIEFALLRTPLRLLWAGQERALLFFVLSGFVLCLPWLAGKPQPYGKFLLGRFCRIYPPYLIAMLLAALGAFILGGHNLPDASIYIRQLGWVFRPDWQAAPSIAAVLNNKHSEFINEAVWSLVWEVRVALIFPLIIVPMVRWGNAGAAAVFVALLAARHFTANLLPPAWSATLNLPQETFY